MVSVRRACGVCAVSPKLFDSPSISHISTSFFGTILHQSSFRTASSSCLPPKGLFARTRERESSTSFDPKTALLRRLFDVRRSEALSWSMSLVACPTTKALSAVAAASACRPSFVVGAATNAGLLVSEWALLVAIKMLEPKRDRSEIVTCESEGNSEGESEGGS